MAIFGRRRSSRRTAAVDGFEFPGSVRQRFTLRHGDLTGDGIRAVEAAGRQWFRLAARHPRARLAMPGPGRRGWPEHRCHLRRRLDQHRLR